jgi:hypothetical protein
VAMLGIFFGLRPDRLAEPRSAPRRAGRQGRTGLGGRGPLPSATKI